MAPADESSPSYLKSIPLSNSGDVDYSHGIFTQLKKRSILPLLTQPDASRMLRVKARDFGVPDLNNVQGDVIYLFPKKAENFIFFTIANVSAFKRALGNFKPTSSEEVKDTLITINTKKGNTSNSLHDIAQYQIAFSRTGLYVLGVMEDTGDVRFDKYCMRDNKDFLGDQRPWDPIYEKLRFNPKDGSVKDMTSGGLHGVIVVAGSSDALCRQGTDRAKGIFGSSITLVGKEVEGRARPGDNNGHEHFGFEDGISQPALRGVVAPHKGQIEVDPGVVIMGYQGDPVLDDPNSKVKRPWWTKDGTIMIYKKLQQSVLPFEDYLKDNGSRWGEFIPGGNIFPPLTAQEGANLFGARLIGRWKSGAPLAKRPFRDDPVNATDADWNNDFDYAVRDVPNISPNEPSDYYCPFTIHTRKTAPRNLDPYIARKYLEEGSIIRAGLPYGPEITASERQNVMGPPKNYNLEAQRGLLFVCYQSSLDNGFVRQTKGYAGNDYFPVTSLVPQKHGQDPIIGSPPPAGSSKAPVTAQFGKPPPPPLKTGDQVDIKLTGPDGQAVEVSGFVKVTPQGARLPPGEPNPFFVTSHGGEYFFVPSISTLKVWAIDNARVTVKYPPVEIMLLVDTTGSMRNTGSQASLQSVVDGLVGTGKWSQGDVSFRIIAFRDHPPQDQTYIVKEYPATSDIQTVMSNMANLAADGGGDGPEAQCHALLAAQFAGRKSNGTKIAFLMTDSPPHGIGEDEDKFPAGCPDRIDPVRIASNLGKLNVTLHVLACEPTLSMEFSRPLDFYKGIVQKSGGRLFGMADGKALTSLIVGAVRETASIETLVNQYGVEIRSQEPNTAKISQGLYGRLLSAGVTVDTFSVEDIYEANSLGDQNARIWLNAQRLDDIAKSLIKDVRAFRLKQAYRSGGLVQAMSNFEQPITLDQVNTVVTKALLRGM